MTNEKMARLDTGRVVQQDIRLPDSDPVPESELVRFHMCGPPDCNYDEIKELHKQIGKCNYAKLHQKLTKMQVAPSTSTVQFQASDDTGVMQTQTPDNWQEKVKDMPVSAAQTAGWEEIKKKVLLELGMSEDLADACIEFPNGLCRQLWGFTEINMPSRSCERVGAAPVEGDSDDDSEVLTSSGG